MKYKHEHNLPAPKECERIFHVIEECSEVQQRLTKILRFGAEEVQANQELNNVQRLSLEIGNLYEAIYKIREINLVNDEYVEKGEQEKRDKMVVFNRF